MARRAEVCSSAPVGSLAFQFYPSCLFSFGSGKLLNLSEPRFPNCKMEVIRGIVRVNEVVTDLEQVCVLLCVLPDVLCPMSSLWLSPASRGWVLELEEI